MTSRAPTAILSVTPGAAGLIAESQGHFDAGECERRLKIGSDE
jgi:hypothetical protein